MKKLSAILSLLLIVGLFHQGVVLAETATKEKKPTKMNFTPKKKHGGATVSRSKKAAAPAVVAESPAPTA